MYTFPELLRRIREEADLTQIEFAKALDVSPALIAMVETEQKSVSKKLIKKLAVLLEVSPLSITPFIFTELEHQRESMTPLEKSLVRWGERMQMHLIQKKAKKLKKYAP